MEMTKKKRIVMLIISIILILFLVSAIVSAAPLIFNKKAVIPNEEFKIQKTYHLNPGDTLKFDDIQDADYSDCYILAEQFSYIDYVYAEGEHKEGYTEPIYHSIEAFDPGVAVVMIRGFDDIEDDLDVLTDYYYVLVIVNDPENPNAMGSVVSIKSEDQTFIFREGIRQIYPDVKTKNNEEAYYTTVFRSDDPNNLVLSDGRVVTDYFVGSTPCDVYVIDAAGHIFKDTCKVTVKYAWWQWIIKIVLFGWIWY